MTRCTPSFSSRELKLTSSRHALHFDDHQVFDDEDPIRAEQFSVILLI
jgi:hypothetical protein